MDDGGVLPPSSAGRHMSIWGKIVGGAAGFALGGPLGALIGGLAGHAVDRMTAGDNGHGETDGTRRLAFTIGVVVLGAKMAKADGRVTRDEVAAFKQVFRIPPQEVRNVGRLFDQARRDARGYEPYARQIGRMFQDNPAVLEELMECLFHIARADGVVSQDEIEYLTNVAELMGLERARFKRIKAENVGPNRGDPYAVLGVPQDADMDTIKAAYRRLVRENHPDRLIAQGLPAEFVDIANDKLAAINAAYEAIQRRRDG
jgi:DnaJ like chaperone protein